MCAMMPVGLLMATWLLGPKAAVNRTCTSFGYVPASGIVGLHWQFCVSVFSYLRSHCVLLALKRLD